MDVIRLTRDIRDGIRYTIDDNTGVLFDQFMVGQNDAYHLCQEFDSDGHPTKRGLERAERFMARARNWTPTAWRLYRLWEIAKLVHVLVVCEAKGHDLVDDSYGGPDSGCMAAHCSRCGWSFHHTLY